MSRMPSYASDENTHDVRNRILRPKYNNRPPYLPLLCTSRHARVLHHGNNVITTTRCKQSDVTIRHVK